jgi:hypothetical protein
MIICLDNLNRGIQWWKRKEWSLDFNNDILQKLHLAKEAGINDDWWESVVDELGRWRAYRGTPKARIRAAGRQQLPKTQKQYDNLVGTSRESSIENVAWEDASGIFELAWKIRPSPVFCGKLCHFIFPNVFFVIDNLGTGVGDYELYWRGMKDAWSHFAEKKKAKQTLVNALRPTGRIDSRYPFETMIIELCLIGHKHHLPK